jgi:hypothetical protein
LPPSGTQAHAWFGQLPLQHSPPERQNWLSFWQQSMLPKLTEWVSQVPPEQQAWLLPHWSPVPTQPQVPLVHVCEQQSLPASQLALSGRQQSEAVSDEKLTSVAQMRPSQQSVALVQEPLGAEQLPQPPSMQALV